MDDATSLLFDLAGFRVVSCEENDMGGRRVVVMQVADEHACPRCGVLVGGKPYDLRESRVKDLPMGSRPLLVVWRKRRYRCGERRCPQQIFTERSVQIPPRHRLTVRLRRKLEQAASGRRGRCPMSPPSTTCRGGASTTRWSLPPWRPPARRCRR